MNKLLIIFLLFSTNIFSQNDSKVSFEEIKKNIKSNNINLEKVDFSDEKLNDTELQILKVLNGNIHNFDKKEIRFISGPAGTTISTKTSFFKSFQDSYTKEHVLAYSIIKLEEKERILSGTDYLVFFWSKTYNPKSKKLLKKIKQTKQT